MKQLNIKWNLDLYLPFLMVGLIFFTPISSTIKSILLGAVVVVVLSSSRSRSNLLMVLKSPWCWAVLGLFTFMVISCLWSPANLSEQLTALNKQSKLLVFPFFVVGFMHKATRQWAMVAFLMAMVLTGCLSILQSWGMLNLHGTGQIDPGYVFQSHIMTGFMMAFASYYCLCKLISLKGKSTRWVYLILGLFFGYQVLFINTGRTGYVIYFLLMLLMLFQFLSLKQALVSGLICMGMFALVYSQNPLMQRHLGQLVIDYKQYQMNDKDSSLGYRIQFHDYAKSLFITSPVWGLGAGSFTHLYHQDKPVASWTRKLLEPHSEYWLKAVEQGVIGVLLLLAFFLSLLRTSTQVIELKPMLLGLTLAFGLGCVSDSLLFYGSSGYFFIVMAALAYGEYIEIQTIDHAHLYSQSRDHLPLTATV